VAKDSKPMDESTLEFSIEERSPEGARANTATPLAGQTCVVTVTYGDRFHLLKQVVNAAFASGVRKVVVVDNASSPSSQLAIEGLEAQLAGKIAVIRFPQNRGSAGGYKAGLIYARERSGCDYIWLLDDDNQPAPDALAALSRHYATLSQTVARNELAVISLREQMRDLSRVATGEPVAAVFPPRSSFSGFHLFHLKTQLRKLVRQVRPLINQRARNVSVSRVYRERVLIPFCPYGGLFFHRDVLDKIGYPDERLFLYSDDNEFTWRFTRKGGRLFLIPSSIVQDLDNAWRIEQDEGDRLFSTSLRSPDDFRIYYRVRNQVHFEHQEWIDNRAVYALNKWFYLTLLWFGSRMLKKRERFALILRAVRDGEQRSLEAHSEW
jgi:GT2 family glycosyltransferase